MVPLANPIWHALSGPQHNVAERVGLAARYDPAIAPFAALTDVATTAAWDALAEVVGPGGVALLFRPETPPPPGWSELFRGAGVQMLGPEHDGEFSAPESLRRLGAADVGSMLELIERTRPGPFGPRTIELGTYLGVRDEDTLVAMAGERMRLPGYTEISAVCTHPAHRGRGLASLLVRALAQRIRDRGERPLLHVAADNVGAIGLYERLGFTPTRALPIVGLRAPNST